MEAHETYHLELLKKLATTMAIRHLCPIFLVGSFVTDGLDAMDVDIVMVATPDQINRMFRDKNWNDRWFRFYKKQKKFYESCMHDVDIDFKVQTVEAFKSHAGLRIKLDNVIKFES
jgi:hypothetical protein